jgi:hypothetical protein
MEQGTYEDLLRVRSLNAKLVNIVFISAIFAVVGVCVGVSGFMFSAKPQMAYVDPAGRAYPVMERAANGE